MSYFAAVLAKSGDRWRGTEVSLADCESLDDIADVTRDVAGDIRLLIIEQDDEYAVLARVDELDDEIRVFLSDGHAADGYPMAALIADELRGDRRVRTRRRPRRPARARQRPVRRSVGRRGSRDVGR